MRCKAPAHPPHDGRTHPPCVNCGRSSDQWLIIDADTEWWVGEYGEHWHRTAGVFVLDVKQRLLLFERRYFPYGLTVPAGHVAPGEDPAAAARRELAEETGMLGLALEPLGVTEIAGDQCRRGAYGHVWHCYLERADDGAAVRLGPEGGNPVWLSQIEVQRANLTLAVRQLVRQYENELGR